MAAACIGNRLLSCPTGDGRHAASDSTGRSANEPASNRVNSRLFSTVHRIAAALLFGSLSILHMACGRERGEEIGKEPPRLVIIQAMCSVNAEFLDFYSPDRNLTPNLAALAEDSAVFARHRTEAGLSGVAYASIFTGRQAPDHGVFVHPAELDPSLYDISEALADNGYTVYFRDEHGMARRSYNYVQGALEANSSRTPLHQEPWQLEAWLDELVANPDRKIAVISTSLVTHSPYRDTELDSFLESRGIDAHVNEQHLRKWAQFYLSNVYELKYSYENCIKVHDLSPQDERELAAAVDLLYQSRIWEMDRRWGPLFGAIVRRGLEDQTVVVFTADHGETLWEENAPFKWSHGHTVRSDVLRVPLLFYGPGTGVKPGAYDVVTRSIDIAPTLAGLLGLNLPADTSWQGVDLSGLLRGEADPPRLQAFSHSAMLPRKLADKTADEVGLTRARLYPKSDMALTWVCVQDLDIVCQYGNFDGGGFSYRLYDVSVDPGEKSNIFDEKLPYHRELARALDEYHGTLVAAYRETANQALDDSVEATEEEALRSLGYI